MSTIDKFSGVAFRCPDDAATVAEIASPGNWQVYGYQGNAPWYIAQAMTTDDNGHRIRLCVHPEAVCVASREDGHV